MLGSIQFSSVRLDSVLYFSVVLCCVWCAMQHGMHCIRSTELPGNPIHRRESTFNYFTIIIFISSQFVFYALFEHCTHVRCKIIAVYLKRCNIQNHTFGFYPYASFAQAVVRLFRKYFFGWYAKWRTFIANAMKNFTSLLYHNTRRNLFARKVHFVHSSIPLILIQFIYDENKSEQLY